MDFDYTPEQIQLRREVRDFAAAEIAPHVVEWDESQTSPLDVGRMQGLEIGERAALACHNRNVNFDYTPEQI